MTRRRSLRPALSSAVSVVLLAALAIGPAIGAGPSTLRAQLVDDVGALALSGPTGPTDAQAALDRLRDGAGVSLWVWLTDSTDGLPAVDLAIRTAGLTGLGSDDLLLVVALDDRTYGYWYPDGSIVSPDTIEELIPAYLVPDLRLGDPAGAIEAFAGALLEATVPADGPDDATPIDGSAVRFVDGQEVAVPVVARDLVPEDPAAEVPDGSQLVAALLIIGSSEDPADPLRPPGLDLVARLDGTVYPPSDISADVSALDSAMDMILASVLGDDGPAMAAWVTFLVPESDAPIDVANGADELALADALGVEIFEAAEPILRPAVWLDVPSLPGSARPSASPAPSEG